MCVYIYIYIYTSTYVYIYIYIYIYFVRGETRLQTYRVWGHSPQWVNSRQLRLGSWAPGPGHPWTRRGLGRLRGPASAPPPTSLLRFHPSKIFRELLLRGRIILRSFTAQRFKLDQGLGHNITDIIKEAVLSASTAVSCNKFKVLHLKRRVSDPRFVAYLNLKKQRER